MDLRNKNVLITGGASGLGKIMARKSLERGCAVLVLWDINREALESVRQEFAYFQIPILCHTIDLAQSSSILEGSAKVLREFGYIDVLINNAGIVVGKMFHEHSHSDIERSMGINSSALMHTTLEFLPLMMERNHGAICNIASSAGLIANPKMSVYAASKWAVVGWSDSLRLEMQKLNYDVSVTTIMPFYISTGMFEGVRSKVLPILKPEEVSERILRAIEAKTKMLAMPMPYWFIRLSQGILPLATFDWVMRSVFGVYSTMDNFKGRTN